MASEPYTVEASVTEQGGTPRVNLTLGLLVLGVPRQSDACSCEFSDWNAEATLQAADALFVGRVVEAVEWKLPIVTTDYGPKTRSYETAVVPMYWYVFEVERAWLGLAVNRIAVYGRGLASCGMLLEVGAQTLIKATYENYAYKKTPELAGFLNVNSCNNQHNGSPAQLQELSALKQSLELRTIPESDPSLHRVAATWSAAVVSQISTRCSRPSPQR